MAAIVVINEYNGAGQTKTANITKTDMGNADAANLNPATYPATPGENTYEKFQKIDCTDLGGSTHLNNLKIWNSGSMGGAATQKTNAKITAYAGAAGFTTPTTAISILAVNLMPGSVPATANLGCGGSLTGTLGVAESDYLVHQIQTDAADVAGSTSTMNYQYDEVA